MKISAEQALTLEAALIACGSLKNLDKNVSYAIAKNTHRLKPIVKEIRSAEEERIKDFAVKKENGEVKILDGRYDFGNKFSEATGVYEDIMSKEYDFEPFQIGRCEQTDALPPLAQAELFDIIITE